MRKLLILLFLLILLELSPPLVSSSPIGELSINLNVTLVNTTPFPKFVIVNPQYNYTLYRQSYSEMDKLNSLPGFWIDPYESLNVGVRINDTVSIPASYAPGNTNIFQGIVYPKLVVFPKMLKISDVIMGDVMIVKYQGKVEFRIKNSPYDGNYVFAVSMPVIFVEATHYDFNPKYTMWFKDYSAFLESYLSFRTYSNRSKGILNTTKKNFVLFSLSDRLITGKVVREGVQVEKHGRDKIDLPIWVIWLGRSSIDISYQVKWENAKRVSSGGRKEEEKIWVILDKRNIK